MRGGLWHSRELTSPKLTHGVVRTPGRRGPPNLMVMLLTSLGARQTAQEGEEALCDRIFPAV
jgi:hypothetical protein